MNRRTLLASLAGLPTLALPSDLDRCIAAYRKAQGRLASVERRYRDLAPGYDSCPSGSPEAAKLRRLEAESDRAFRSASEASALVVDALDRAGLLGIRSGPDLFAIAELQPEDVRRLVVIPVRGIDLAGR